MIWQLEGTLSLAMTQVLKPTLETIATQLVERNSEQRRIHF
jgi:hypothetical protein